VSEWQEVALGEIAKVQTGPFGSQLKNEQYITGGTPVVTVEHICNFRIRDFAYPSVTLEDKNRLSKYLLKEGDIIFTRVGSVDLSAYVQPHQNEWMFSSRMLRVRPDERVDSRFLSYYFQQKVFRDYILNISVGATMPSINTEILKGVQVSFPSKQEQKAIASVLSSLDDKIDLLHRQNTTLEAMAETLFRQWFVEKAQEDWEEVPLKDVVDIAIGRTPPRQEHQWFSESEIDVKWISIKDMGNDGVYIFKTSEYLTKEAVRQFNIPVIPEDTVVLSFKMTLGRVAITTQEMLSNEAIAHFKFTSKTPFIKEYLFLYLKTFKWDLLGSTSSIVTSINSAMIKDMEIAIPDIETMNKFKEVSESLFDKVKSNQQQIQTLEKLRDNLLPKLMSGEVRVSLNGEYHDAI
jgi:type I restriction enzyme S subunit